MSCCSKLDEWPGPAPDGTAGFCSCIDCDFARTGELAVATQPWQAEGLRETARIAGRLGTAPRLLDADAVRAELNSPTYQAGLWDTDGCATSLTACGLPSRQSS